MNGAFFKAFITGQISSAASPEEAAVIAVVKRGFGDDGEHWHIHPHDWEKYFSQHCDKTTHSERMDKSFWQNNAGAMIKSTTDPEYRWITVHPNGDDEKGVPVRIRRMHDGSWGVIAGAGGKLNGLRMQHIKSQAEYKEIAAKKAQERAERKAAEQADAINALKAKHAAVVQSEARAKGQTLTPEDIDTEAHRRATEEYNAALGDRSKSESEIKEVKKQREKAYIEHVAQVQGWKPEDYSLSEDDFNSIRERKMAKFLDANPELAKQAYENEDGKESQKADLKIQKAVNKTMEKVIQRHHDMVYRRAVEAMDNRADAIVAATDGITSAALGDIALGDVVKSTLGDSGKGYVPHIEDEAADNGVTVSAAKSKGGAVNWDSRLERNDYDVEKTQDAQAAIERRHNKAAEARQSVKRMMDDLSEGDDSPLARLANLNTKPSGSVAESAQALAKAKQLQADVTEANKILRDVRGGDPLETLPNAAVLTSSEEMTPEEAMKQVVMDVGDLRRERAVDGLMQLYNVHSDDSKLVSHVLSGRNGFLGNVGQLLGIRSPDPLVTDIIGEHGAARLMANALLMQTGGDKDKIQKLRTVLENDHIAKQADIANEAIRNANEKFEAAKNVDILPIEDMDSLFEGLDKQQQAIELHRQGREIIGTALGRLQAAAALNEALGRIGTSKQDENLTVSLGAISSSEAVLKAAAMGLTDMAKKDAVSGSVLDPGDFDIFNDGKNKILMVNPDGMDILTRRLNETPEFMQRAAVSEDIKAGKQDEAGWLPAGFSDRPRSDVSRPDSVDLPKLQCQIDLSGIEPGKNGSGRMDAQEEIGERIKRAVAQRIEAGHDPKQIQSELGTQMFKVAHVPKELRDTYDAAMKQLLPEFQRIPGQKPTIADYIEHQHMIDQTMRGFHEQFIAQEAEKMGLKPEEGQAFVSLHSQSLPQTRAAADLIHQVSISDPRLRVAFMAKVDRSPGESKMIRDYAYEHLLKGPNGEVLDPTDNEHPIEPLSPQEHRAFEKWNEIQKTGDPYGAIQQAWRDKTDEQGGGLFGGDVQHHDLATVNLADDAAVLKAARDNWEQLGYQQTHVGLDPKTGNFERAYIHGLEPDDPSSPMTDAQMKRAASKARDRIESTLRNYAVNEWWGATDGTTKSTFDPSKVKTAGNRWSEYVKDMGGVDRAYDAVCDHMKGDFISRFAHAYKERTGHDIRQAYVPVANAESHAYASLPPEKRQEQDSLAASERARMMNRAGGKFAEGSVKEGLEAKKQAEESGMALFDTETGKKAVEERGTHRVTIGNAAENMIAGMLPNLGLSKGTSAIADLDMSSGNAIKRQRAIKLIEANKRQMLTMGTGSGKTSVALGSFSDLKAKGKVKRAIMAVPSVVQEQFGSEAARFYDPTDKNFPKWFSDSSASARERRAAYREDSGHDICVVTHQALRDDLNWAVARHNFGGDTRAAAEWMEHAPEAERNAVVQQACKQEGWNFDMSVVDEGHNLLNRQGKTNSAMANTIDAFTADKKYHVPMSADPTKNDASESFDLLRKVAPDRYVNDDHPLATGSAKRRAGVVTKSEFMRRYAVNTPAASEALAREMAPYQYAESIPPDVQAIQRTHVIPMTAPQREAYNKVRSMYQRARQARMQGKVDVDAVRYLSPSSFEGLNGAEAETNAARLQDNLGLLRDTALSRVVNTHPQGAKMEWLDHRLGIKHSPEMAKLGIDSIPVDGHPKIIFAYNLAAVSAIEKHLKAAGIKTARLDGTMTGKDKEKAKQAFSPAFDESTGKYVTDPTADVIISSDSGAVGWNGQRADHSINWDTSDTAMIMAQRNGRSVRTGQRNDVHLDTVMTDTPFEHRRRERVERKDRLRDTLTASQDTIDDSGLASEIKKITNNDVRRAEKGVPIRFDDSAPVAKKVKRNVEVPMPLGNSNKKPGVSTFA